MTTNIIAGIWRNAPFQGSIVSSIYRLNKFLEEQEIDMKYDIMPLAPGELSKNMTLPNVFIFDGGEDVDPGRYEENNRYSHFSKARDKIEFDFAKFMSNNGIKMCGVCRGHQLLNVFKGGTLFQDIRKDGCIPSGISHHSGHKVKVPRKGNYSHHSKILEIADFVGLHSFAVSSLHHQSIHHFGRNILPSLIWEQYKETRQGRISGYVIEGIESIDSMIRGVQSHPEFKGYSKDGLLFAYLMFVDHFSASLTKVTDEQVARKFSNLIKQKQADINSGKNQYVNMSRRNDVPEVATNPARRMRTYSRRNSPDLERAIREEE